MPAANSSHPIANGLRELSSILEREKSRGHEFVDLSPEATDALQSLPVEFMQRAMETPASTNSETTDAGVETTVAAPDSVPAAAGTSVVALVDGERTEEWAREQLNKIFLEVKNCEACRALGTLRETIVFATGNPLADVMFIGEAPGAEEEKQKKPFVGPAGQKLTQIIGAMGLSRDDVYISNIVKFRPKKGDGRFQGSSNRKPDQAEMASCISFIRAEIEVVQPKVIVALGGTAAEGFQHCGSSCMSLPAFPSWSRIIPVFSCDRKVNPIRKRQKR
jgi:DNA polymerase